MGDERTNDVFFDNVFVHDDYVVGELNHGFQYISEALDLERFTMFTFSPIEQRLDLLSTTCATATVDGEPMQRRPGGPPAASRSSPPTPRSPGCSGSGSSPRR